MLPILRNRQRRLIGVRKRKGAVAVGRASARQAAPQRRAEARPTSPCWRKKYANAVSQVCERSQYLEWKPNKAVAFVALCRVGHL
jgi:hypothetical protein